MRAREDESFGARIVVLLLFRLQAQSSFFGGKTIRIIVGLPAGDAYDRYARIHGTYMGKYIPDHPHMMVQNMPGASSMIAANFVYTIAKPDGPRSVPYSLRFVSINALAATK